jgi:NTE family protein
MAPEFASGRTSMDFLVQGLRERHGVQWPTAPMWVVAVRRRDGRRTVFGREGEPVTDVGSAVAASCAIPGYFEAIEIDGASYVDGGVHSPTNADLVADLDLDLVVISSPMSIDPRSVRRPRADLGLRLLFHRYLREEMWVLRRRGAVVVAVEPETAVLHGVGLNLMRARNIDRVEEAAQALACRRLADALVHLERRRDRSDGGLPQRPRAAS